MASIKISELNEIATNFISVDDFFPLDDSGSLTTYRVSVGAVNSWLAASGSVLSASYALTSSNAITSSNSITSSNAITASYALTSSYSKLANDSIFSELSTEADHAATADLATTAAYATNAGTAVNATNATTAAYAVTAAYADTANTSAYALTALTAAYATNALTAAYALTVPSTVVTLPPTVTGLRIMPNWGGVYAPYEYSGVASTITVKVDGLILYNSAGNSKLVSYQTLTNNRLSGGSDNIGAGGVLAAFTSDKWYGIWVIHNSVGNVTSTVLVQGDNPGGGSLTLPYGDYDYAYRVGTVKDESGNLWREWYEYGPRMRWFYRYAMPSGFGLNGYSGVVGTITAIPVITHSLGDIPRSTSIRMKIKYVDSNVSNAGFNKGDELRAEDFLNDYGGGATDLPVFGTIATSTTLKVWRVLATHNIRAGNVTNGVDGNFWGNGYPYFDLIIMSEI